MKRKKDRRDFKESILFRGGKKGMIEGRNEDME